VEVEGAAGRSWDKPNVHPIIVARHIAPAGTSVNSQALSRLVLYNGRGATALIRQPVREHHREQSE
jgi:hypothetical protein